MDSDLVQVRHTIQETVGTLSSSRDGTEISKCLEAIRTYLDQTKNPPSVKEKEEFINNHFTTFLRCLVSKLSPDWLEQFPSDKDRELWHSFFLEGPADQSFMVLLDSIISVQPSFRLNKVVNVLEQFLQRAGLSALMWEVCKQQTQVGYLVLQEGILSKIVCLPDHLSNKLQRENRSIFFPQNYFPLLGTEIVRVLEKVFDSLRGGLDCSISFVSQVLGKVCVHGRQKEILSVLVPYLADRTQSDCIWQRMSWRLIESVPDRWMEAVVLGFVQSAPSPAVLSRLLGNLVVKSRKAQFVMTQKLLLLQFSYPTAVLQNILGYLALDSMRRSLLIRVLKELLETWSSSSAVKHSPAEQQLYLSKAILICLSQLKEAEMTSSKSELLTSLMEGMKCHLDSNLPRIRHMGMVVAECVSAKIMPEGPPLKFQYEDDDEIRELKSLLMEKPEQSTVLEPTSGSSLSAEKPSPVLRPNMDPPAGASVELGQGVDSELDSDDDLVPCDMSEDKEFKKVRAPTYLQDCIEILTGPEDTDKYEATMSILELLIRRNTAAAREVSVELTKVLLHLEDKSYIEGFEGLRQGALVAITVTDPIPVAQYLTSEFYSLNYSLRQRMDILDVLALAAQELFQPSLPKAKQPPGPQSPRIQILSSSKSSPDWRKVVDERIQKKTRKFAKGHAQSEPPSAPNKFGPIAGYFFFPLLRNLDRPLTTFDLLGDDHLVLGRLAHTLAILMYFAVNTVVAPVMGKALLEFVWTLRFHTDVYVRQGLLSCVSSIFLSVPAERLIEDMTEEILETRAWLTDVVEKDPAGDCRSLALQNLLLLENLKKKLETSPF